MLRDEILLWMIIIQIMLTCIIALDIYARMEANAAKKPMMNCSVEEMVETHMEEKKPVVYEAPTLEIKALNTKTYYSVPLDEDLQDHIFALCESRGIDPAIVIAMIGKESTYNKDAVGDSGNSQGLMQIQPRFHMARIEKLGVTNLFDPYQNVEVGIDLLDELYSKGKSIEWTLMAYNGGASYANEKMALGIVSDYVNTVLANARTLDTYEVVVEEVAE